MIHGISYGFGESEQIAPAVVTKHAQGPDHTVRRYRGDDAGGNRTMTVSRIEDLEGSRLILVQEAGGRSVQETGIRLVQETGDRLIKKSGIRLAGKERFVGAGSDKVVS